MKLPGTNGSGDRITRVWFGGLRTLRSLQLDLTGLTVLVGENAVGKSTLLEGLELLRLAAGPDLIPRLHDLHGGPRALFAHGERKLQLEVEVEGPGFGEEIKGSPEATAVYRLTLGVERSACRVEEEQLDLRWKREPDVPKLRTSNVMLRGLGPNSAVLGLVGTAEPTRLFDLDPRKTLMGSLGIMPGPHPAIERVRRVLEGIAVHPAFDATPAWAAAERSREVPTRDSVVIQPATTLSRFGGNLPNAISALQTLHGAEHWEETLGLIRLGLGDRVEQVVVLPAASGGRVSVGIRYRGGAEPVPAHALSDGTLAYLCFVAAARLGGAASLLAFDEPETHMHPGLLFRVLGCLESLARSRPVVIATHSDALLDMLEDPATQVRVLELDRAGSTQAQRLDREALTRWREEYRGLGQIRSEGLLGHVLADPAGK